MRLREQTGRRIPGYTDAQAVVRKVKGINEPAEKEFFPNRPPPVSPFPELVLSLSQAIDRYLGEREAASRAAVVLPLWMMQQSRAPSMERPDRRMWRALAAAVVDVREALLKEGLSREEQAREREVRVKCSVCVI